MQMQMVTFCCCGCWYCYYCCGGAFEETAILLTLVALVVSGAGDGWRVDNEKEKSKEIIYIYIYIYNTKKIY